MALDGYTARQRERLWLFAHKGELDAFDEERGYLTFTHSEAYALWDSILASAAKSIKIECELDETRRELEAYKLRCKAAEDALDRIYDACAEHTLTEAERESGDTYEYAERELRGG